MDSFIDILSSTWLLITIVCEAVIHLVFYTTIGRIVLGWVFCILVLVLFFKGAHVDDESVPQP